MGKVTPELIADREAPAGIRLSPDAKFVVYTLRPQWSRKSESGVTSLWMANGGEDKSARQLTSGNFHDSDPQFSPDGKYISFVSDRDTLGKLSTVYLLPVTGGGEALPLTPAKNKKSIGSHQWSPNGRYVAFTSADEKEDKGKDDAKTYGEAWEHARLRLVDTRSKEIRTLVTLEAHVANFAWSPDSESLAYTICENPEIDQIRRGAELRIIQVKDGATTRLCHFGGQIDDLTWHGGDLFWAAKQDGKSMQTSTALWRTSSQSQDSKSKKVAYGEQDCARGLRRCGKKLVVYVQNGLSDQLELFDSGERVFAEKLDISSGWDACFDGDESVVAVTNGTSPSYREAFSIIDTRSVQLSQHGEPLPELQPYRTIQLEMKASDGMPVDGIVYIPNSLSSQNGPHPAVVVVHGGPYDRAAQGRDPIFSWTPWLLSLGYVVLHPNYRGGSGHGKTFAEAVVGDPSQSFQDIVTLVKHCIADGLIDEKRVAISGWSQGGYLSYLAVTRDDTFHFAAAIAGAGVSCWDTLVMSTDVPVFESVLAGASPWLCSSKDATCRHASPIWFMQNISTPLLILHGEDDVRVPVGQALSFHRGMLARGKDCELVTYPREGHGYPKMFERAHYIHMLKKMKSFLEKHV